MIINRVEDGGTQPPCNWNTTCTKQGFGWKPAKMFKVFNKEIINEFDH